MSVQVFAMLQMNYFGVKFLRKWVFLKEIFLKEIFLKEFFCLINQTVISWEHSDPNECKTTDEQKA